MEEELKILEEFIESIKNAEAVMLYNKEIQETYKKRYTALENLLTRYKQLEKQIDLDYVEENYIEKSKIQAKIEELKDNGCCRGNEFYKGQCVTICQNYSGCMVLQELLKEE